MRDDIEHKLGNELINCLLTRYKELRAEGGHDNHLIANGFAAVITELVGAHKKYKWALIELAYQQGENNESTDRV